MSLTHPSNFNEKSIINIIKAVIPTKNQFYSNNDSICFNTKRECAVPYTLDCPYTASLCGTAFDYLARFLIAQKIKNNKNKATENLVSERLITSRSNFFTIEMDKKYVEKLLKRGISISIPQEVLCGKPTYYHSLQQICKIEQTELQKLLEKNVLKITFIGNAETIIENLLIDYNNFLKPIKNFINNDFVTENDIIERCIVLAKMEQIHRSGVGIVPLSKLFEFDTQNNSLKMELQHLLKSFKKTFMPVVNKDSIVVFNPHFGIGSRMIGGADADIYVDGTLYDFKTSIKNGWNSTEITQILAYYFLDAISKQYTDQKNELSKHLINRLALYKVRYEEIAYFDVDKLDDNTLKSTIDSILSIS